MTVGMLLATILLVLTFSGVLSGAWERLGDITGQSVNQDIINRIFEKFCVGK